MIGLGLQKKLGIPWLADFRDPWTNIDYYRDLKLGKRADAKHRHLEKKALKAADAITVISPGMEKDFNSIHPREYFVIPNGFDAEDMHGLSEIKVNQKKFVISHIGSLTKTRNPVQLWEALKQLVAEDKKFEAVLEIRNVGKMDVSALDSLRKAGLEKYLNNFDYLPHSEVLIEQRKAALLLLLINDTPNAKLILTGKLFEYLAARRPVICIGPKDGDAAKVIRETGSGEVFGFDELGALKATLRESFQKFKLQTLVVESKAIDNYERKNLTKKMGQVLNSCIVSQQESGSRNS
jgi:glycosyltransferase involved in cell wall biosynthesis